MERRIYKHWAHNKDDYTALTTDDIKKEDRDKVALLDAAACGVELDYEGVHIKGVGNIYVYDTVAGNDTVRYILYDRSGVWD